MNAKLTNIRISPKKLNVVAGLVRNRSAQEALDLLKFIPKKGAPIIYKVLHSAVSNAEHNFKQKRQELVVQEVLVSAGPTFKRIMPVSRGRARRILKRTSHLTVTVRAK
jgi:large subunit ribosomal protein L22